MADRRYREDVPIPGMSPFVLPWPMTTGEAVLYIALLLGFAIVTIIAVTWAAFTLIEPSLWRLVPTIVWLLVIRLWLTRAITRSVMPDDVDARWAQVDAERQDPPGAAR